MIYELLLFYKTVAFIRYPLLALRNPHVISLNTVKKLNVYPDELSTPCLCYIRLI